MLAVTQIQTYAIYWPDSKADSGVVNIMLSISISKSTYKVEEKPGNLQGYSNFHLILLQPVQCCIWERKMGGGIEGTNSVELYHG